METPSRPGYAIPLYRAVLEPRRSADMHRINTAIILFALASLPLSLMFGVIGAWPISVFVGLDAALFAAALRFHFWLGRSREILTITHDAFTVERIGATGRARVWKAQPHWLRVEIVELDEDRNRLEIRTRDECAEIGAFLTAGEKVELASELRNRLQQLSVWRSTAIFN